MFKGSERLRADAYGVSPYKTSIILHCFWFALRHTTEDAKSDGKGRGGGKGGAAVLILLSTNAEMKW